eukprot:366102-Chlamydomonas_euryale.AAC.10
MPRSHPKAPADSFSALQTPSQPSACPAPTPKPLQTPSQPARTFPAATTFCMPSSCSSKERKSSRSFCVRARAAFHLGHGQRPLQALGCPDSHQQAPALP